MHSIKGRSRADENRGWTLAALRKTLQLLVLATAIWSGILPGLLPASRALAQATATCSDINVLNVGVTANGDLLAGPYTVNAGDQIFFSATGIVTGNSITISFLGISVTLDANNLSGAITVPNTGPTSVGSIIISASGINTGQTININFDCSGATGGGGGQTGNANPAYAAGQVDAVVGNNIPGGNNGDVGADFAIPTSPLFGRGDDDFNPPNPPPGNNPPGPFDPPAPVRADRGGDNNQPRGKACDDCLAKLNSLKRLEARIKASIGEAEQGVKNEQNNLAKLRASIKEIAKRKSDLRNQVAALIQNRKAAQIQAETAKALLAKALGIEPALIDLTALAVATGGGGTALGLATLAGALAEIDAALVGAAAVGKTFSEVALATLATSNALGAGAGAGEILLSTALTIGTGVLVGAVVIGVGFLIFSALSGPSEQAIREQKKRVERRREELAKAIQKLAQIDAETDKLKRELARLEVPGPEAISAQQAKITAAKAKVSLLQGRLRDVQSQIFRQRAFCRSVCPPGQNVTLDKQHRPANPRSQTVIRVAATQRTTVNAKFSQPSARQTGIPLVAKGNKLTGSFDLRKMRRQLKISAAAAPGPKRNPADDLPGILGDARFNLWLSPSVTFHDDNRTAQGQNGTTIAIAGGASWMFNSWLNAGVVASYSHSDLKGATGKTDADSWSIGTFIQAMIANQVALDVVAAYSRVKVDSLFIQPAATVTGGVNANAFSTQAKLSRAFKAGDYTITPDASISLVYVKRDSFILSDGTFVPASKNTAVNLLGGASISRQIKLDDMGMVFTPSLGVHGFVNAARTKSFINVNGTNLKSGNYGITLNAAAGFKAPGGINWSLGGSFSALQGGQHNYSLSGSLSVPLN